MPDESLPNMTPQDQGVVIIAKLDHLAQTVEDLSIELARMRERVYGNGRPGLITELADTRRDVSGILSGIAQRDKLAWSLAGAVGMLILGLLWSVFTGQVTLAFGP